MTIMLRAGRAIVAATLLIATGASPNVWASPNPYMGDPVEQARAPSGALMSARLAATRGSQGAPSVVVVRPGVWVLRNFSIVNCTVVETPKGLVVFDTGTNVGQGEVFLREIRKLSAKPIIAIIYSHFHYTSGATALAAGAPKDLMVIGHPKLETNYAGWSLTAAPYFTRRLNIQFGAYLPASGEDAGIAPPAPNVPPEKLKSGHLPVNRPVADGEKVEIGGTTFQFFHAQGDTDDTLTVWIPELQTVLTNVISQTFFALYTLRGETYRDPQGVIDSYDTIRRLRPTHYVPSHGPPLTGADAVYGRMTAHRDAYSYTFNQAIRGINRGWSPDELVANIPFPSHLASEPTLNQAYSEYDFALRGIYRGLIGWFAEDGAEMHPPRRDIVGAAIVQGFGGMGGLLTAVKAAQDRREYALAARLAGFGVDADPKNAAARQAKADALRSMAQVAYGSQSYNFLLTEALDLEGKIDRFKPVAGEFGAATFDSVAASPPRVLVSVLEARIDPERAKAVSDSVGLTFTDVGTRFRIEVRRGVAEVQESKAGAGAEIVTDRRTWFDLASRAMTLSEAVASGKATVSGRSPEEVAAFLGLFDPI